MRRSAACSKASDAASVFSRRPSGTRPRCSHSFRKRVFRGEQVKIAVFGLGYVGCVSGACIADLGHQVVGVDVNITKVDMINAGKPPVVETGLAEFMDRV